MEGVLIDIGPSNGAAGTYDPSEKQAHTIHFKEFPLPHDLVWERTPEKVVSTLNEYGRIPAAKPVTQHIESPRSGQALQYNPKLGRVWKGCPALSELGDLWSDDNDDASVEELRSASAKTSAPETSIHASIPTPASIPFTPTLSSTAPIYSPQPPLSTFDSNRNEPNLPHPSQFTTYADASNHFYTSLDRSILEKPLQHPQISVAPVVPPSAPPNRLLTSEPHSPDRPNWAKAGETVNQDRPRSGQGGAPIQVKQSSDPKWDFTEQHRLAQNPQLLYPPEQFSDALVSSEVFQYVRGSPQRHKAISQPQPRDAGSHWQHDLPQYEPKTSHDCGRQIAHQEGYDYPPSPGHHYAAISPTTPVVPPGDWEGLHPSSVLDGLTTPHNVNSWDVDNSDTWNGLKAFETRRGTYFIPDSPKPKHADMMLSKSTSGDASFMLPPPDKEPPMDCSWEDLQWKRYAVKKGHRLRLPLGT